MWKPAKMFAFVPNFSKLDGRACQFISNSKLPGQTFDSAPKQESLQRLPVPPCSCLLEVGELVGDARHGTGWGLPHAAGLVAMPVIITPHNERPPRNTIRKYMCCTC